MCEMHSLYAGVHLPNKPNEFLTIKEVDFEKDVLYLKKLIGKKLNFEATKLELVYNGNALKDDMALSAVIVPDGTVHCFQKTRKCEPRVAAVETRGTDTIGRTQGLFNIIANIQININSRVNILQKILSEYPEFRRNLGALALIRDSVLFNTFHQPSVIKKIAQNYPIICEAAPFIVSTIKKELARNTSSSNFSEPTTDSTNSSEEENSLGASDRNSSEADAGNQSESARIRMISRQQLQAALAQIGFGSANSLSNIAQRNSDTRSSNAGSGQLANSASGERISSDLFRSELQRALSSLNQHMDSQQTAMDVTEQQPNAPTPDDSGDIPASYRTHHFAQQLRTMAQMGFLDYDENITYLNLTNGNIENAINLLMGSNN